jgi:hypothetical protein
MAIDTIFEDKWKEVLTSFESKFGGGLDMQGILFLIGIQELGKGPVTYTKDQKLELMHIAICTLLTPFGYYKLISHDEDGWPHYENLKKLPSLNGGEQLKLMKDAVVDYWTKHEDLFA